MEIEKPTKNVDKKIKETEKKPRPKKASNKTIDTEATLKKEPQYQEI